MRIRHTIFIACLALSLFAAFSLPEASAQTQNYQLLAPLEGTGIGKTAPLDSGSLAKYLQTVFNLGVGIAVALAVVMIVIGGAQYLSTDAVFGKEEGKGKLWHAVWGLILALGVFVILYTINPNILNLNLDIKPLNRSNINKDQFRKEADAFRELERAIQGATTTIATTTGGAVVFVDARLATILRDETQIRSKLQDAGITVNKNPCREYKQLNCTNVGGLPPIAIERLSTIKQNCSCVVQVTGGTEYWLHSPSTRHGPANAVVDLSAHSSLNQYLIGINSSPPSGTLKEKNGSLFKFEGTGDNAVSTGPHWHVVLNYR